jgi:endonuclease/exonuclease/phosphatase family metal-dependent hydrolase
MKVLIGPISDHHNLTIHSGDRTMIKKQISLVSVLLGFIFCLVPLQVLAAYYNLPQQPQDPQPRINILSLNVMQKADEARSARFQRIVNFLASTPVHLMALQELSGGPADTPPTEDSGADLAAMLATAGLSYGYYTEANWGYPPFVVFKVGVLPQYRMLVTAAASTGTPTDGWVFPERKNVVMCGVDIPAFGRVNLYSVHVYTPSAEGIETQIDNLLQFVNQVDAQNPAVASIVAGDMNFSVDSSPIAYQKFLAQGFVDSYAQALGATDPRTCCTPGNTSGCTYGVPGNPFSASSPFRIDFIFVRGSGIQIKASKVVFNGIEADFVSDHCAVLTEITRQHHIPLELLLLQD